MAIGNRTGRVLAIALGVLTGPGTVPALAQTFERDTKITGPRGRSIERQVDITRSPAGVERDITIHRPGGATFQRDTFIPRGGFGVPQGPRGPAFFGGGPVFVGGGGGGGLSPLGAGLLGGAIGTGAGMLLGSAIANSNAAAAQPPVFVTQPVVVGQPVVEYVPPVRYQPSLQPVAVIDPVAQQIARLQSHYEPSRREACQVLGRLGDARAVGPLVERLKNDTWQDVRIAAATSLGQIGDPNARIYLERSVIYDKKQAVRDASTVALARLPYPASPVVQQAGAFPASPVHSAVVPPLRPLPSENVPPPPTPAYIPR